MTFSALNRPALAREIKNEWEARRGKLLLNMLLADSTEGAHRARVLLGIIATCRRALRVPAQA